jgi:hypothetical protein
MASLAASPEHATYTHFITMTNSALDLLKNELVEGTIARNTEYDILQHNDPNLLVYKINGSEHRRKPDNIFVTLETAQKLHGDEHASWSDITAIYATESPTKHEKGCANLDWGDALCSVEHKRTSGTITRLDQRGFNEKPVLQSLRDLDHLRPSPTKSSRKRPINDLSEVNETPSGSSTCVLVGCPDVVTFRLAERAKTSQGICVTATGPPHAVSEDHRAYAQGPAPEDDLLRSVAIQSAEYGLGRLCCSYDISHTFALIVVGTNLPLKALAHSHTASQMVSSISVGTTTRVSSRLPASTWPSISTTTSPSSLFSRGLIEAPGVGLKTRISGAIEMGRKTRLLSPWREKSSHLI